MIINHLLSQGNSLRLSDSVLYDFVFAQVNRAHIKDAKNGCYIMGNRAVLKVFNLSKVEHFVGYSVFDIDKFMRPYWGDVYAKNVAEMDYLVKTTCKVSIKKQDIFLSAQNQICVQDLIKLPLMGLRNKVTSVLTISNDLTAGIDLFYLLSLYKSIYSSKSVGLSQFIKFLGVADFFSENLTDKEILCLLHMRVNSSYKNTAKALSVGVKTIETHVSHIIDKLKTGQLSSVLSYLRNRGV